MGEVALPDYLKSDDVKLEDVKLREIDSFTMMEAFREVADIQKLDKETYVRTVAEVLGFSEDQYDEFARVTITNAEDNIGPNDNSCNSKTPTLTRPQSSLFGSHAEDGLGTSQAPTANNETYVRTVTESLGYSEDQNDEFARVTIKNAEDKIGSNENSCDFNGPTLTRPQSSLFGSHAEDGLGTSQAPTANNETYVRTVTESLGYSEDQNDEFARVTIKNAEDKIGSNENSCDFNGPTLTRPQSSLFGSHAEDGLGTSQAPTANKETYVRTVAEALGYSEDQYDEFARVTIKNAEDKIGSNDNSCNFKGPTLTRPQSSLFVSHQEDGLGTSQAPTANKETYVRTVAESLGFSEDQNDEFRRVTIKNAEDNIGPNDNSCDFKTPTLTPTPQSSVFGSHAEDGLGTSQAPAANKETYVRTVTESLGFSEDRNDEFARVTMKNTEDKIEPNDNSCDFKGPTLTRPQFSLFVSHQEDGLGTSQAPTANGTTPSQITINQTVDDIGDSFGELTAPSTNKTARAIGTDAMEKSSDKASMRSILNMSMLNSMTVKDLPERIRTRLLSLLRFQRRNRQKQAVPQKAPTNNNWASFIVNIDNEESNLMDLSFEDLANDMREISVIVNKKKKNSRAKQGLKQGRSQGQSSDGMSDYHDSRKSIYEHFYAILGSG